VGLERAAWLERRYGAVLQWMPFDLHPEYPPEGVPRTRPYEPVAAMFEAAGLPYAEVPLPKLPNSRGALILGELARERDVYETLHPRLFSAYWAEGRDIGDPAVLVEEAVAAGMDAEDVREALAQERHSDAIERSTRMLFELGAGGVPAWLVDERLLVPGAQPHEVFERVLEQLGHPALE
jgi:predicted DsbA family dithiol-disulfide isomerase